MLKSITLYLKRIVFIIGIAAIFTQCSLRHRLKETSIKIQVRIVDKLESNCFEAIEDSYYFAYIELSNNTDSVFQYWTMTCAWQDNWMFETKSMFLYYGACTRNFPKIMQIKPGEKKVYKSIICIKHSSISVKGKDLKLGFVLINKGEVAEDNDFYKVLIYKIKNKKDIIWSESFKIDK
jgi:hypothetical protein